MKNSKIKFLLIVMLVTIICVSASAQTNVNGGIYTNTTWTVATVLTLLLDTIVVFPGVTLTIEPGVTVEFADGKYVEIRQGSLIALGNAADSITILPILFRQQSGYIKDLNLMLRLR